MSKLAIIPARGGSKRIPRKNIKNFLGKPILAYSIELALSSELFDEVMVSTEDEEIAQVAREYGAKVPFLRSKDSSDDHATLTDVLIEVLEKYQAIGKEFEFFCCMLPTAPLLSVQNLRDAAERICKNDIHTVFPMVRYPHPIQRAFVKREESGCVEMLHPEYKFTRTQDLQQAYHDTGQFYFAKSKPFLQERTVFGSKLDAIILDPEDVQDIDDESDWKIAEWKYKAKFLEG